MTQKRQNDVSFNQDGGRKCTVFTDKTLAPKSMQEKESNVHLWIC